MPVSPQLRQFIDLVKHSGLFDGTWYLQQYPDAAASGMDPVEHYLRVGARQLRDPSPRFSTRHYLTTNPDVASAGVDPLCHYIVHGAKEGRTPLPQTITMARQADRVDVIVPVFNAPDDVRRCLQALRTRDDGFSLRVIVVNDGSDAATSAWLREFCAAHGDRFTLIEHEQNLGYTQAVNNGLRAASAPYLVTLNSDTIVTRGWLKGLLRCLESDPRLGIVGPLSNAASWQSVPQLRGADGQFVVNELPASTSPDAMATLVAAASERRYPRLPFLNGFCLLMRRTVVDAIGAFDEERFPLGYGEENDFCLRAADAGFELAVADDTYVFHAKSRSFGHERREELSAQGDQALRARHGAARIDALLAQTRHNAVLDGVRARLQERLAAHDAGAGDDDLLATPILFLLPAKGGSGGANSVVQEAAAMRQLGAPVNVAVPTAGRAEFIACYGDMAGIDELVIGFTDGDLVELARRYAVVVGTIHHSMPLVRRIIDACPGIVAGYYVQDYEPLFFAEQSEVWRQARASYTLVEGAVLFAKTRWLADKVRAEHPGLVVHKVQPSIDLDVFKPAPRAAGERIRLAAMIRPTTPYRGPQRTLDVLARVAAASPDAIELHAFGCSDGELALMARPAGMPLVNHGFLKRREVARLLAGCDVFIDLSDYQAFGRTALEAMACGCAAMVTCHGGSDEYAIDGINALVVDSFDVDECAQRLQQLCEDRAQLRRLQVEGLMTASRYPLRAAIVSALKVLNSALHARRQQARPAQAALREGR
ncbi:MAG: glycosyltransferase [Burkholderiales bacterium]|nr:glycosyltransferase [Burkholderiales bacterium]